MLTTRIRYVDIALQGDDKEIWVEPKSLQRPFRQSPWKRWAPDNTGKNEGGYSRQFSLDRIGATRNKLAGELNRKYHYAERFEWWLQSFKTKGGKKGYTKQDINGVKQTIPRYPRSNLLKASFGYTKAADAKPFKKNLEKDCYINTFSIKSWIMSPSVKEVVLEGIANTIINEFELPAQLGDVSDINIDPEELKLCSL